MALEPETEEIYLELGHDGSEPFKIDANIVATGRTCVIGASGSGKSYAVGVICEELCKNRVPFAIVDTEGEHSSLREKYEVVWLGEDDGCDLRWEGLDVEDLATQTPDIAPLIIDVSETSEPRQKVASLLKSIYAEVERRKTPYLLVVEEADRFIPQNGERLPIFGEIARRGRKRGLGLMVCTQRPSLVDKNILSQCGNQLIGKLVIRNDLQAVAQFFSGHELPKQLTGLSPGRFYALGGLSPSPRCVTIRKKETRHAGSTPKVVTRELKPLRQLRPGLPQVMPTQAKPQGVERAAMTGSLGFTPAIREEDVPEFVRKDRSYLLFGTKEIVTGAQIVFRPFVEVGVTIKRGLLKRRMEMRFLLLDGPTGRFVELGETPMFREGFERLIGLTDEQMDILRAMKLDQEFSVLELANKIGVSKEVLRRPMRQLEENRLIRAYQVGKSRLYRRLISFPEFRWMDTELPLESVNDAGARLEKNRLDEDRVRHVIRGLIPHSDLQSFRPFLYPLYKVELMLKRKKRMVWLDGRGGSEVRL